MHTSTREGGRSGARKRGGGEGSIHKRSDGRWVAILDLGYSAGKRRRRYLYGATRREVQQQLAAALRDRQDGVGAGPQRLTVEQFLQQWLEDFVRKRRRIKTYESYAQMVRLNQLTRPRSRRS